MATNKTIHNAGYFRTGELQIREVSQEDRTVELSFSSEQGVSRWFGTEYLCHDPGCMVLDTITGVGSVLFHHGRDPVYGSLPVAVLEEVWVDEAERRGKARIRFDTDEKSELIFQKVKGGSIKGISVGYTIDAYEEVKAGRTSSNGRFSGPCYVATRWTPREISIEPVPADDSVGIGRSNENEGEITMAENQTPTPQRTQDPAPAPAPAPTAEQARQEERARIMEIQSMARDFDLDLTQAVESGASVEQVRQQVLTQLRQSQQPLSARQVVVETDEEDKYRAAARDGLLQRMGYQVQEPAPGADQFRGMSLQQLMMECAQRSGEKNVYRMDMDTLWRTTLNQTRGQYADSSAFLSVVNSTLHAVVRQAYRTAPTTFQHWTSVGSNSDFKPTKRYRLAASGEMHEVMENGEFKTVQGKDEGVDTSLKTYGKKFGFSRQIIINDNLGTVAKMITAQVRSNQRFINRQVYGLLIKNPTMQDNKKLFDAAHNNLMTGAALSVDTLNEFIVKMAQQKGLDKKDTLAIRPAFLLVPMELEMAASRLLESAADPSGNNSGILNPMRNKFQLISDPELSLASPDGYYAVADPNDADGIEVTYLNGKREPTLESTVAWDVLGVEYRMYLDVGFNLLDYRGLAHNPGK